MILDWKRRSVAGGASIFTSMTERESVVLVRVARGRRVLEIGSAYGYSAVLMAKEANAMVYAVDPHTEVPRGLEQMTANIRASGVEDRVKILHMTSDKAFVKLRNEKEEFEMVFIDGDHSYHQVKFDVLNAMGVLADRGVLACHDFGEDQCVGVKQALTELFPEGPDKLVDTLWIKQWPAR